MEAYDPATGFELWKSDGTIEGTLIFKDILSGQLVHIVMDSRLVGINYFLLPQLQQQVPNFG